MTAREWLNVLAILSSIDDVPGMPALFPGHGTRAAHIAWRMERFRADPIRFLQRADGPTQAAIWAEVSRRLAGGAC